jgi:hypothetical protein
VPGKSTKEEGVLTMKKQTDLTNYLFRELERLEETELEGERLTKEIERAKAQVDVAMAIVANGTLILNACRLSETASRAVNLPLLLKDTEQ